MVYMSEEPFQYGTPKAWRQGEMYIYIYTHTYMLASFIRTRNAKDMSLYIYTDDKM